MHKWVRESGSLKLDELKNKLNAYSNVQYIAMFTDRFEADNGIPNVDDTLLELRLFNETFELHVFRSNIDSDFFYRVSDDTGLDDMDFIVNYQKLDVNRKEKKGHNLMTTVGGRYTLPINNESYAKVIDYIEYDEDGMVMVTDYRIVRFMAEEEVDQEREKEIKQKDEQEVKKDDR